MPQTAAMTSLAEATRSSPSTWRRRRWIAFARHFVVMLVAMYAGMLTLYPAYTLLARRLGYLDPTNELPVISAVAMALAMALPMAALMRRRLHTWWAISEMTAAMVIPTLAATFAHLVGAIPAAAVMTIGHITMIPAMLAVMLLRFDHYAGRAATQL